MIMNLCTCQLPFLVRMLFYFVHDTMAFRLCFLIWYEFKFFNQATFKTDNKRRKQNQSSWHLLSSFGTFHIFNNGQQFLFSFFGNVRTHTTRDQTCKLLGSIFLKPNTSFQIFSTYSAFHEGRTKKKISSGTEIFSLSQACDIQNT